MPPKPIRLTPADAARYAWLRLRMLTATPWAFAASPDDDFALDPARLAELLAEEQNAVFAVEAADPHRGSLQTGTGSGRSAPLHGPTPAGQVPVPVLNPQDGSAPPDLVAVAGIRRMTSPKFAHRARLWGVFVEPDHRGRGLGRAVVSAAVDLARTWPGVDYIDLGVSENAPEARRLYESLGFREWGREPQTTQHEGRRYDEIHMTLRL